jgi:hypothetical protein
MKASREELKRELADIELALSMQLNFRSRQVLIQQREEVLRQLRLRRSGWRRWFGRD